MFKRNSVKFYTQASLTLAFAFALSLLPMPGAAYWMKPSWVLLCLIYWIVQYPQYINIATAWFVGLLFDVAHGSLLGEHAFAFAIVAFIIARWQLRFRLFSFMQQMLLLVPLFFFYQLLLIWPQSVQHAIPSTLWYWVAPVITALLWPWAFILLEQTHVKY